MKAFVTVLGRSIAAASLAILATACGSGSQGGGSQNGDDPYLTDGQGVLKALDAIEAKSGSPLRVTMMEADQYNGLSVDVQEPAHHINVDRYVVAPDGSISGPKPVQEMSMGGGPVTAATVDAAAFDPRKVAFARLSDTTKQVIAKSNLTDAKVTNWELSGLSADDRRYIYVESPRGRAAANFAPDMTIQHMSF